MNPIENVWAQLKHYVNKVAKPTKKEEHIAAIKEFWETKVTPQLCQRYIYIIWRKCCQQSLRWRDELRDIDEHTL